MSNTTTPAPVSAIVLAKDEEGYIERCIRTASFLDEVVVVDSGSTDRTVDIARELGATVVEQEWLGWSAQRNRGIEAARNDWVFVLEADEVVTATLRESMLAALRGPLDPRDGYTLARRSDFLGELMPDEARKSKRQSFVRLFNRTESRYDLDQLVHEEVRFPGRAIPLDGILLHWRGHTLTEIGTIFNRYATVEAEMLDGRGTKATALHIAVRPVLRFLWCYVRKGGWRMGPQGLMWSLMKAMGEYLRYANLWERQNRPSHDPDPPDDLVAR